MAAGGRARGCLGGQPSRRTWQGGQEPVIHAGRQPGRRAANLLVLMITCITITINSNNNNDNNSHSASASAWPASCPAGPGRSNDHADAAVVDD